MRAILMAAGRGMRLREATGNLAKALAPVQGRTLVEHQLATLQNAGFEQERIVVVGGCDYDKLAPLVRATAPRATLLHNPRYTDQNLLSLLTARDYLHDGFLVVNVDHLMPHAIHRRMMTFDPSEPVVACVDNDRSLTDDDMKVALQDDGRHIRSISKQLTAFERGYIGMTRCTAQAIPRYLSTADEVLAEIGPLKAVVEMILGKMATTSQPPAVCDASGFRWFEVDTPEELDVANVGLAAEPRFFEQC